MSWFPVRARDLLDTLLNVRNFMNNRRRRLGQAGRGIVAISSGTLVGQVIIAVATPFVAQIYPPDVFGSYSALLAVASVVGSAAALKFDSAVLLPDREADARGVLWLSLLSTLCVSCLTGVVMWLIGPVVLQTVWKTVPLASIWVAAMVLTTGMFTSLVQAALRGRRFGIVGWRSTIQSAAVSTTQISLGLVGPTTSALLAGMVIGRLLGFAALIRALQPLMVAGERKSLGQLCRRYWRSPVILAPSALLNALGSQIPLIFVAAWYGADPAGQLGMAQRLVFLPAALVGAAIAQVFGVEIAERLRENRKGSRELYLRSTARISVVGALMCAAILILSPIVLPWLLGPEWHESAYLAQAMAISASASFVVSPLSQVYLVHQSAASLTMDTSRVALIGTSLLITSMLGASVVVAIWAVSVAQVINYLTTWLYGLRIVSRAERLLTD